MPVFDCFWSEFRVEKRDGGDIIFCFGTGLDPIEMKMDDRGRFWKSGQTRDDQALSDFHCRF